MNWISSKNKYPRIEKPGEVFLIYSELVETILDKTGIFKPETMEYLRTVCTCLIDWLTNSSNIVDYVNENILSDKNANLKVYNDNEEYIEWRQFFYQKIEDAKQTLELFLDLTTENPAKHGMPESDRPIEL